MQTQPTLIIGATTTYAQEYIVGETQGRRDGARRYGMADTRKMNEARATGYRDGYYSTVSL